MPFGGRQRRGSVVDGGAGGPRGGVGAGLGASGERFGGDGSGGGVLRTSGDGSPLAAGGRLRAWALGVGGAASRTNVGVGNAAPGEPYLWRFFCRRGCGAAGGAG
ncbi:MAG: hypothetical protein HUU55_18770 [Myxococcales bacterium]|nr:hypothetical protein [Myxococcales bacterium]